MTNVFLLGHGYIVASALLDIEPKDYTQKNS